MAQKHKHLWSWFHTVFSGKRGGVAIVRRCDICKRKEVAHITEKLWVKATGDYALPEHYR